MRKIVVGNAAEESCTPKHTRDQMQRDENHGPEIGEGEVKEAQKITSQLWIRISAVAPSFGGTEQNQRNRQSHPRIRHRKKGPNKQTQEGAEGKDEGP